MQGPFPRSWKRIAKQLSYVDVSNNAGLHGCVPADRASELKGVITNGTGIAGRCASNAIDTEWQQRNAMQTLLPEVVPGVRKVSWFNISAQVGSLVAEGEDRKGYGDCSPSIGSDGTIVASSNCGAIRVVDGVEYVATLAFEGLHLNTSRLVEFVKQMPQLEAFECLKCKATGQHLPPDLAAAAPRMRVLRLEGCGLAGPLPASWGNWSSLRTLELKNNNITGTLPESFAALRSLGLLDLSHNNLRGTLPARWGQEQVMPDEVTFTFSGNPALNGTVPSTWARFNGQLEARDTRVHGCLPGGLRNTFGGLADGVFSSLTKPREATSQLVSCDVASLLTLKGILERATATSLATWSDGTHEQIVNIGH
jgi:hypothetical protein